jgi:DNA-directed RNA polymerase subunit M/transcription elongation factor TFIIS
MLSLIPSLRLIPALKCPKCGQLLALSCREEEHLYCPECGYAVSNSSSYTIESIETLP